MMKSNNSSFSNEKQHINVPILINLAKGANVEIIESRNGVLKARINRINGYRPPRHLLLRSAYKELLKYKPEGYRISIIL